MKKILILAFFIVSNLAVAKCQILYSPNSLSVNTNSIPGALRINNYDRMIWKVDSINYIAIDLSSPGKTSIYGSNNCINFFDADKYSYNGILVEQTYIMSDSCAKEDVKEINVDFIDNITPISFKWKNTSTNLSTDQSHYGFIAQELLEVAPEVVSEDDFGNLMVNYHALIPILIKTLQQVQEHIEQQTAEIEALITELDIYNSN